MPYQSQPANGRLPLLDGMRGIAALAVVTHHEPLLYSEAGWLPRAYLAVDFFFLLSGFVLTLAFEKQLSQRSGTSRFMAARLRRLWPVMAISMIIGTLGYALTDGPWAITLVLITSLLLIPLFGETGAIYPANGPIWSLAFELLANLAHALLLRRMSDRVLLAFAAFNGVALAGAILHFGHIGIGDTPDDWWAGFVRIGFSYSLGVWFARQYEKRSFPPIVPWWIAVSMLSALLALLQFVPLALAMGDVVAAIIVLPVIFWCSVVAKTPSRQKAWLTNLGKLSYPLYALHIPILGLFVWLGTIGAGPPNTSLRIAGVAFTVVGAWLIARSPLANGFGHDSRQARQSAKQLDDGYA